MKKIVLIIFLCSMITSVYSEKIFTTETIHRPDSLTLAYEMIYIVEKTTIHIFNLKTGKFMGKFGKEGEGPQEFKINPFGTPLVVVPYKNQIMVSSMAKVSFFTMNGKYIKENKVEAAFGNFIPFGKNWVCIGMAQNKKNKSVLGLFLCNPQFKKTKDLYLTDFEIGPNMKFDYPTTPFDPGIEQDKFYIVAGKAGFAIDVFDQQGNKLYRIKKDYKPLALSAEYRENTKNWFKTNPNWKALYDNFVKPRLSFKDRYPSIYQMFIDSGKIYVFTFKLKEGLRECIVMDLQGKILKTAYLPVPEMYGFDFLPKHTIYRGTYYILTENEEEETWELHKYKIDSE